MGALTGNNEDILQIPGVAILQCEGNLTLGIIPSEGERLTLDDVEVAVCENWLCENSGREGNDG